MENKAINKEMTIEEYQKDREQLLAEIQQYREIIEAQNNDIVTLKECLVKMAVDGYLGRN